MVGIVSDNAPGPDIFNACFKSTWEITGKVVTESIQDHFLNSRILRKVFPRLFID